MTDAKTRDKHGREIKVGDVLKVFHFTGPRRKRFYMYKQVVGLRLIGGSGGTERSNVFDVCHLNLSDAENYTLGLNEGIKIDYEIVQGLDEFDEREKVTAHD